MTLSGRLSPNVQKPFGSASVTTTIQPAWTPASSKRVRLMGFELSLHSATPVQIDLTDGTAAASGTISTHFFDTDQPSKLYHYGAGKALASANTKLGIKARAGAGTISGTFYGREDTPA